jgi:hypothetical protein
LRQLKASLFLHHCERNEEEIVRRRLHMDNQSDRFILVQASRGQTRNFIAKGNNNAGLAYCLGQLDGDCMAEAQERAHAIIARARGEANQ